MTVTTGPACTWSLLTGTGGTSPFITAATGSPTSGPGTKTMTLDVQHNRTASVDRPGVVRISTPSGNIARNFTQAHPTVRIRVTWDTKVDIDLHVLEPAPGERIHAGNFNTGHGFSGYLSTTPTQPGRRGTLNPL